VKSLVAVTLLAMLGGLAVAVTNHVVSTQRLAPATGSAGVSVAPSTPRADSSLKHDGLRDSTSVKVMK
jgi:Na+-transporting methylmalonyl-CoA/oxaloacetate decarboxylase beta subunit